MLFFNNYELEVVPVQKVVGYTLDSKLTWGPMIDALSAKARKRLAALTWLRPHLDSDNMKTMYIMFVRSILEYGCIAYMRASPSALLKLDRVQASAQKVGSFEVESLQLRREAMAASFALKLLNGEVSGPLRNFIPALVHKQDINRRGSTPGLQFHDRTDRFEGKFSLGVYKRGFWGAIPTVWSKMPQQWIKEGSVRGWNRIRKKCTKFILNSYRVLDAPLDCLAPAFAPAKRSRQPLCDSSNCNNRCDDSKIDTKLYNEYMKRKRDGILIT